MTSTAVPPSSRLGQALPRELDEFVLDCLRKKPEDRPADASALLERIVAWRFAGAWSNHHARAWWEARLPQFAGPLDAHSTE